MRGHIFKGCVSFMGYAYAETSSYEENEELWTRHAEMAKPASYENHPRP